MSQDSIVGNVTTIINNADGTSYSTPLLILGTDLLYIESKDLDLGDPTREKYLDWIIMDMEAPAEVPGMSVQVGYRNALKDPIIWLDAEDVELPNPRINCRIQAKFFRIKFSDNQPISQWQLSRIEFWGRPMYGRL